MKSFRKTDYPSQEIKHSQPNNPFTRTIFGLMLFATVVGSVESNQPKEDTSFVDPRLTLIPEAEVIGATTPATLIILHPPKTGLTTVDYLLRVFNWLGNKAREQPDFYLPQAKVFPTMIRDIIQEVRKEGKLISPHKVGFGWRGGIESALQDLVENRAFYRKIQIITGHMPWGLHWYDAFNGPVDHAIVVWDPYQRLLSLINFEYQRGFLDELRTDEEKYNYWLDLQIDNLQTRMAAGLKYMSGECTEATLQAAKANIEKFLLAGVSDDIPGFIQALVAHYPGIGALAVSRQQVTGVKLFQSSQDVPKWLEEKIRAKNTYDAELYLWVKKRWYEYKSQCVIEKPSTQYLTVRADAKNYPPNYETESQINNYNAFFTRKYQGKPVNNKDFTSRDFFEKPNGP